ncbi:CaiB/BaiF CoA transferase family protein [Amycolatopsis jiangsuensis]|uniref:Crotonobetainyl-CoA:carnitine CoA-transferase CaiB-like acyl-CoA transferase n=1 Tax=Amycolatopsis jiangsuensis TaxID=1181879 RepID=A0A840J286_9PSEU|nr:CoA transferase [Amycolatopsis jiangsuensis]MBB4689126.1 crotonobetainyl-CoA:carnitine CoA-transferase CaiB-like acyl-CoA transferase [Amycolatopsis jiangsuensis]
MSDPAGALDGLRVIDMAAVVMGPYAAQILGDLGADVIKVEPPAGDLTRHTHPRRHPGMGALALNVNRNKRSIALDLKAPEGREAFLELVRSADVLITNTRPGGLRRLGLDPESLAEVNPRLVFCTAQGFRSDSGRADLAAYDEIVQSASGLADLMRRATGQPAYVPTILADKVCALTIVYSVLAAVVHQRATGQGQHVEVPMTDTMLAFNLVEHLSGQTFEPPQGPVGFPRSLSTGHRAVPTADGWACILPYTPRNIHDFFLAVDREEFAEDQRFADAGSLSRHYADLYALIEGLSPQRTTAEWAELCAEHSIPFAPVLDLDDAPSDEYFREGGVVSTARHPTEGEYRLVGSPVRLSGTPATVRRHTPHLGEHTTELLEELGLPADRIAALADQGVIRTGENQ